MLKMIAQTGNNMFQYAACKSLASKKGYEFSFRGGRKGALLDFFVLDGESRSRVIFSDIRYRLATVGRKREFRPRYKQYEHGIVSECFDPGFFEVEDWTTIKGFFQSPRYFEWNRENILRWFSPRDQYMSYIESVDKSLECRASERCCIHIRRGDYVRMDKIQRGNGWVLPLGYYLEAISILPRDIFYIIVCDDKHHASKMLGFLKDKLIVSNTPAIVDMFLFTRCKYNIIANSSFSWWGAWLNKMEGKEVIAPKYHLGWPARIWFPDEIAVTGWKYVDVLDAMQKHGPS